MTVVAAIMARSWPVSFDDLDVELLTRTWDKPTGVTTLTFAGDLAPATAGAIRDRMTSRDDADQAKRADLCALRDELASAPLETLEDALAMVAILRDAAVAHLAYTLGE